MTGSSLAPIVIPIVVMFGLAAWIVMVFHAASHPQWRDHAKAVPQSAQPRRVQLVSAPPAHRPHRGGTHRPHRGGTRHPLPAGAAKG